MYVAPELDKSWLQSEQRKLYRRSWNNPVFVFRKLWGLITDLRNLRVALARVARNRGRRTAGADGITVGKLLAAQGGERFVEMLRDELRSGNYRPSPARRVLIPKRGQPGKFRPLGIPTVKDRVVQAAMKNILEPVFEADFFPASYGFRPGKCAHGALEHLRLLLRPTAKGATSKIDRQLPYQWAIEGDIKGCFDNISHHGLMVRVRQRVADAKTCRLVVAFLKAGVLSEEQWLRTDDGTPQGGILSPLLANIALSVIEERYERHVWPRRTMPAGTDGKAIGKQAWTARCIDRRRRPVFFPIRYADDFIILIGAPRGPSQHERAQELAEHEKAELAKVLRDSLHLELSETKTLVTPVIQPMRFLGHHVRVRVHPFYKRVTSSTVIPKNRSHRLRENIKNLFRRRTTPSSLEDRLALLNPLLRGWGNFYRHAANAKRVFASLDAYVWHTILRWLKKKHPGSIRSLLARYGGRTPHRRSVRWRDGRATVHLLARVHTGPFKLGWMTTPDFACIHGEPGA
jgi:group II intron reverse transcriptase/maturase